MLIMTKDEYIDNVQHQGKTIAQWEKDFNGMFDKNQLLAMIRGGTDLQKILVLGLDENDSSTQSNSMKDWVVSFTMPNSIGHGWMIFSGKTKDDAANACREWHKTHNDDVTINQVIDPKDNSIFQQTCIESNKIDEAYLKQPEDVVTVKDLIVLLNAHAKQDDKLMFRCNKKTVSLFDVRSKNGIAVVDLVPSNLNMLENEDQIKESKITGEYCNVDDLRLAAKDAYPENKDEWMTDDIVGIVNGNVVDFKEVQHFKPDYPSEGTFFLLDGTKASKDAYEKQIEFMINEKEKQMTSEGRNWRTGGYGGTGRSYSSLGSKAPKGAEIGWYKVEELDPKAIGKMPGWRCGPSNFPFKDLFFPNRKYKIGTMVMRNKYVKAGPLSGEIYIAIPKLKPSEKRNSHKIFLHGYTP